MEAGVAGLSFETLVDFLRLYYGRDVSLLAMTVGLPFTYRTMMRWRRAGAIPFDSADQVACFLGRHPTFIWGDEYWTADLDRPVGVR